MSENIVTVVSSDGSRADITIRGNLTIETSSDFRAALIDSLEKCGTVVLHPEGMTEMDLTGLQILCSGCKSAAQQQKSFTFEGKLPAAMRELIQIAGLNINGPCSNNLNQPCIWYGGVQ